MTPHNGRQRTPDILSELLPIPAEAQQRTDAANARARVKRSREWEKRNRTRSYRISAETHEAVKRVAAVEGETVSQAAERLLRYALHNHSGGDVNIETNLGI